MLYTLERSRDAEACPTLHVFNRNGARILSQTLSTPVPCFSSLHTKIQLACAADGALYALR